MEKFKVHVIYYTQSGQLKKVVDRIVLPLQNANAEVSFYQIVAKPSFPFPWPSEKFFDVFPETFSAIPCNFTVEPDLPDTGSDLLILAYSPWYLSPSLPFTSFLISNTGKKFLHNKNVITVIACRNMWIMAQEKVKKILSVTGANLIGNIVLRDKNYNLISVLTIIRWLIKGRQEKKGILPRAGVSEKDICDASKFGEMIFKSFQSKDFENLQKKLLEIGAVRVFPNLLLFEKNGSRIFGLWANKILKNSKNAKRRRRLLKWFKIYLISVLFLITPIATPVYFLIKLLKKRKLQEEINYFSKVQY